MPRSGVPYRVYFFTQTQVQWFDADAAGQRTWSRVHKINEVWPCLDSVPGVLPVSATILNISVNQAIGQSAFLDVTKGSLVPDPRTDGEARRWALHAPTWDVGPLVLFRNTDKTANVVDMRSGSEGSDIPFPYDANRPMLAVPGTPLMWFTTDSPPRVSYASSATATTDTSATAFFENLQLTEAVVDATVVYGAWPSVLADATAALSDDDVRNIIDQLWWVQGKPEERLAVLCLLSGLRPASYHPQGLYGIAQLAAGQLTAGGWTDSPEKFLDAAAAQQIYVLVHWIWTLAPAAHTNSDAARLLALLLTGQPVTGGDDATIVARAPLSARVSAFAAVSPAGVPADVVTLGDLRQVISEVLAGPHGWELAKRVNECSLA